MPFKDSKSFRTFGLSITSIKTNRTPNQKWLHRDWTANEWECSALDRRIVRARLGFRWLRCTPSRIRVFTSLARTWLIRRPCWTLSRTFRVMTIRWRWNCLQVIVMNDIEVYIVYMYLQIAKVFKCTRFGQACSYIFYTHINHLPQIFKLKYSFWWHKSNYCCFGSSNAVVDSTVLVPRGAGWRRIYRMQ